MGLPQHEMGTVVHWYQWPDIAAFESWHIAACAALGIPHPNRNAATGEVDENAQWTVAYTTPVTVAADDIRAWVGDDAATVTDGLGDPCDPPPQPETEDLL